jgi:hypothetical protein
MFSSIPSLRRASEGTDEKFLQNSIKIIYAITKTLIITVMLLGR